MSLNIYNFHFKFLSIIIPTTFLCFSFLVNHSIYPLFLISPDRFHIHCNSCKNVTLILILIIVSNNSIPFLESISCCQYKFTISILNLTCENLDYLTLHYGVNVACCFWVTSQPPFVRHYTEVVMIQCIAYGNNLALAFILVNSCHQI